jgi:hypothetical protein
LFAGRLGGGRAQDVIAAQPELRQQRTRRFGQPIAGGGAEGVEKRLVTEQEGAGLVDLADDDARARARPCRT